ncbi:MAG: TonB-dependent receptor [Acidobacteria bacterium]|nr:TonB-dependent receptor [Acidobacteriota bacterium]
MIPRTPGSRNRDRRRLIAALFVCGLVWMTAKAPAQDASTSAVWGKVFDPTGARVSGAQVKAVNSRTGVERSAQTGAEGLFSFQFLPAGEYWLEVSAAGLTVQRHTGLKLDVGGLVEVDFRLTVAGPQQVVTVEAQAPEVESASGQVSSVIDQRAIEDLPLNGRRFSDLALLTPGVSQDPRSLNSSANGDLAFGGVRGFQSSFLVDGADNNNAFFAQARGRYRAPYQFSNEVVQEFRVSSNTYGAELGRAGGAVVNVVTKSGANQTHGSLFYYLRHSGVAAQHPFVGFKPRDRQHQFGFTLGGRLLRNRVFYFGGFDQHIFRVPTVVRFADGSLVVNPTPADFEFSDEALVFDAADQLSLLGGEFRAAQLGNAGFFKLDVALSPRHYLAARVSTSRYSGENNVFLDPTSPVTNSAVSSNGEETVHTESVVVSLTSALTFRSTSHLRVQYSRDRQESSANSSDVRTRVSGILNSFGRSSILPRQTREQRLHVAETFSFDGRRHSLKFGADVSLVTIRNFFPLAFGGFYIFDDIRVNPFTFVPQTFGLAITPLRAFAHTVPRFYSQNFGTAESRPDTREYALFAQDAIRVTDRLAVTVGLRWDLQTFRSDGLVSNPLWPDSGRVPTDTNNFAPRLGFAYSIGATRPLVIRGGSGIFYTRIPQIYNSAIETQNGLARTHLFLDNADFFDRALFPSHPNPLVACGIRATICEAPASVASRLTSEISAFASDFQTPFVHQASLTLEREVAKRFALSASYLYVHGQHLIRARDVNLPQPATLTYPVFDEDGAQFLDEFLEVDSFATWQFLGSLTCPFPPCINPLARPLPEVGPINVFESAASSVYHGFTFSARRRMSNGLYFRLAYTFARAIDDTQDALVAGRPAIVQNSFVTRAERGSSVTDQRHRFVASWIYQPRFFHRDRPLLSRLFNDWKLAGVVTAGSGRPVNARTFGDANRDTNTDNDRLPGARRNGFVGPDYATVDLRLSRRLVLRKKLKLDLMVEAFNTFNRANKRVEINDDGSLNTAARFVQQDSLVNGQVFPAQYRRQTAFLRPTDAYTPRQMQFAVKLTF